MEAFHRFPDSFLWGADVLHYQNVDPGLNPWSYWLETPFQDKDEKKVLRGLDDFMGLAAGSGLSALRIALNWQALEPEPGSWNQDASAVYRAFFNDLSARGITPFVTLFQGQLPHWFHEEGGWLGDGAVERCRTYVAHAVGEFKAVRHWITMETPLYYALLSSMKGQIYPALTDASSFKGILGNLMRAHRAACEQVHEIQAGSAVGLTLWYWPAAGGTGDRSRQRQIREMLEFYRTGRLKRFGISLGTADLEAGDFLGINFPSLGVYSSSGWIEPQELPSPASRSDAFYEELAMVNQQHLLSAMEWGRSIKPGIYLTRHAVFQPEAQIQKLMVFSTIRGLWNVVNESWPVRGYFHHDLGGRIPPGSGAGLWHDTSRGEIALAPAGEVYRDICSAGGISSAMGQEHAAELYDHFFPGRGARDISMNVR